MNDEEFVHLLKHILTITFSFGEWNEALGQACTAKINELKDETSLSKGLGASDGASNICIGHWFLLASTRPPHSSCSHPPLHCIWSLNSFHSISWILPHSIPFFLPTPLVEGLISTFQAYQDDLSLGPHQVSPPTSVHSSFHYHNIVSEKQTWSCYPEA